MDKEILNKLSIGEKAVDITEYFFGERGMYVAYDVTIYTRKKGLFGVGKIKKTTFPFHFATESLAKEFASMHENFSIYHDIFCDTYYMYPRGMYSVIGNYAMIKDDREQCAYAYRTVVNRGSVWSGLLNYRESMKHKDDIYFSRLIFHTKAMRKENTSGKTTSYLLAQL